MKKSGGRGSRQKGDQFERDCVNFLNERGVSAARVPLSGAMGGIFAGDLRVNGNASFGSLTPPVGCITDLAVQPATGIQSTKLIQQGAGLQNCIAYGVV